jgi:hypothetical protein
LRIVSYAAASGHLCAQNEVLCKWVEAGIDSGYGGVTAAAVGFINTYRSGSGEGVFVNGDLIIEEVGRKKTREEEKEERRTRRSRRRTRTRR